MIRLVPAALLVAATACRSETTIGDQTEPALQLTSPAAGAWLPQGSTEATGEWAALTGLTVNGAEMQTTGTLVGDFTGNFDLGRGISIVQASGTDGQGDTHYVKQHVLAGEFTGPRNPVEDGGIVRMNEEGVAVILGAVEDSMDSALLASLLVTGFPVYEGEFLDLNNSGEGLVGVDLFIDGVTVGSVDLNVELMEDEVAFTASIYNLQLNTSVVAYLAGSQLFDTGVDTDADRIDITGTMTMSAYEGELDIQLLDSDVVITGFFFDSTAIPGNIEGALLSGPVENLIEGQVAGMLEDQVTTLMRDTLTAFDLSFETELLGRTMGIEAEWSRASIDPAGIELAMDIDVDLPNTTSHPYQGVLTAPGDRPTPDANADVSMSIWDDMLNKVLFEAWRSEMLVQNLSSEDGSLPEIALLALHADAATLTVDGLLPPVIVEDAEGNLEAQMGEVYVTIDMEGSDLGSHLELALYADVDVDLVVAGGVLDVRLGRPNVDIMVRDGDWGASNEATSALLEDVLPIDLILSLVGDLSFPLPDLPGITFDADAGRDGNGTHTAVRLSLSRTSR